MTYEPTIEELQARLPSTLFSVGGRRDVHACGKFIGRIYLTMKSTGRRDDEEVVVTGSAWIGAAPHQMKTLTEVNFNTQDGRGPSTAVSQIADAYFRHARKQGIEPDALTYDLIAFEEEVHELADFLRDVLFRS